MHGPAISDPSKIEEREIPSIDVEAYKAAGWVFGGAEKDVSVAGEAKADAEAVPAEKPKRKASKK